MEENEREVGLVYDNGQPLTEEEATRFFAAYTITVLEGLKTRLLRRLPKHVTSKAIKEVDKAIADLENATGIEA